MKKVILVCEGMGDEPLEDLGGRTPLEVAKTPFMDSLAKKGKLGLASFTPHRLSAASDVACMSILGYDPEEFYTGLAPLEVVAMGLPQTDLEIVFRCDLVTVFDEVLVDSSASRISPRESQILVEELNQKVGNDKIKFYAGEGYKNILFIRDSELADALDEIECVPPASIVGQKFTKNLPEGQGAQILTAMIDRSKSILAAHEVNRVRIDLGENPANMIWLWGQGKKPKLPGLKDRFGLSGVYFSRTGFVKGLCALTGLAAAKDVENAVEHNDFTFVYSESADPVDPAKKLQHKIKKIEDFDSGVVGPALKALEKYTDYKICVTTDCAQTLSKSAPVHGRVPFLVAGTGFAWDGSDGFDEKAAAHGRFVMEEGHRLMEYFLKAG